MDTLCKMKILNLYAGIGGNRKLWGEDHDITAVELDEDIAKIYQDFFPNDNVIVADAHQYLLDHFQEYDFIWSSPPCPSHSRIRNEAGVGRGQNKPIYPDLKLYEEIILLKHMSKLKRKELSMFNGKFCVENVIAYYKPLIPQYKFSNHYFWTNFYIKPMDIKSRNHFGSINELINKKGFDIKQYNVDKIKILRYCVEPELGLHILKESQIDYQSSLFTSTLQS